MTEATTTGGPIRIAAISDLHCTRQSAGALAPTLHQAAAAADVVVLGGDLTDYGLVEEAHVLAKEVQGVRAPLVAVLGNHDYESGHAEEVKEILTAGGIIVLDGESIEVRGLGIAGIKGFCGGFGRYSLGPWGEPATKAFVREAIDEALKLESALARLRTPQRLALLHFSPIRATVEGEPPEIFPFLGSSRLEEPLIRYPVSAVVHGHAHKGQLDGTMSNGVPVYNAALPLLRRLFPDGPHYRLIELASEPVLPA
jgi:Icc-related predicted phosphoesterase